MSATSASGEREVRAGVEFRGFIFKFQGVTSTGASSALKTDSTLAKNAIANHYELRVQAAGDVFAAVSQVGQVRKTPIASSNAAVTLLAVVVDFGTLVTIDRVAIPDIPHNCYRVTPWNGSKFDTNQAVFRASGDLPPATSRLSLPAPSDAITSVFTSEVRTERLQIELVVDASVSQISDADLFAGVLVHLPAAPADLELRLNDGPPLWSFRGPVPLTLDDKGQKTWFQNIDVKDAVNQLVGKAGDSGAIELRFVLTAKQPGLLKFVDPDKPPDIAWIQNVANLGPDDTLALNYASEGALSLTIGLPDNAHSLDEIHFTLLGNLPLERVLPPIGPGSDASIAKLVLDGTHAACARIPPTAEGALALAELTGVRLPLRADASGAEVRAQLWSAATNGEPDAPIDAGLSQAITLDGQADDDTSYRFATLNFQKPIALDPDPTKLPYVALLVGRGRVAWSFAQMSESEPRVELRVGPPNGPWRELPGLFHDPATVHSFGLLGGRLRIIGHAPHDAPLAPLSIAVGTETTPAAKTVAATPTPKGVIVAVSPDSGLSIGSDHKLTLTLSSYIGGSVSLKGLQVVFHTSGGAKPTGPTTSAGVANG